MSERTATKPVDVLAASVARVRRRELAARLVSIASLDLTVALSLLAVFFIVSRLFALSVADGLAALVALGGSLAATGLRAAVTLRLSHFGAAVLADERLLLKERVSSALYLQRHPEAIEDPAWSVLVRRDGERALEGAEISRHFPIKPPRAARWILLPAAMAIGFVFVPSIDILGLGGRRQADAAFKREVEKKRDDLQKAIEELRRQAEKPLDPEIQKALEALASKPLAEKPEQLSAKELSNRPPPSPDEMKRDALVELGKLEEKLRAQLDGEKLQALKSALDRLAGGAPGDSQLSRAVRDALKSGKLAAAREELGKLKKELDGLAKKSAEGKLTPEEAEKLQKLARELERLSKDTALLAKLSKSLSGLGGELSAGNFQGAMEGLSGLESELDRLAGLLQEMKVLEEALNLAEATQDELAQLHRCPNCGKVSDNPGGT